MRLAYFLFATSALLLIVIIAGFMLPRSSRPSAGPHPQYRSLDRSGVDSADTLGWGYAMGIAILATMGASVILGVARKGRTGPLARWLGAGFVCLAMIFTALVASYRQYAAGTDTDLLLGLPEPTAWMLYGVWLFPFLMVLAAVALFDTYFSEQDARDFDQRVRQNRSRREGDRDAGGTA
jgi:hypothetical protein